MRSAFAGEIRQSGVFEFVSVDHLSVLCGCGGFLGPSLTTEIQSSREFALSKSKEDKFNESNQSSV